MQNPKEEKDMMPPLNQSEELKDFNFGEFGEGEKPKAQNSLKALLPSFLIAVIVCFAMIQFFFAPNMLSKDDATTNFTNIATTISGIQETQAEIKSALTSKADSSDLANLSNQISNIENRLNDLPSTASIESMSSQITNNVTAVINDKFNSISSTISDMQADITELQTVEEDNSDDGDSSTGELEVDIRMYGNSVSAENDTVTARLYFINDTDEDIDLSEIDLFVYVSSYGTLPTLSLTDIYYDFAFDRTISNWGKNRWYISMTPYLRELTVEADDTLTKTVSLVFYTDEWPDSSVQISIEIDHVE